MTDKKIEFTKVKEGEGPKKATYEELEQMVVTKDKQIEKLVNVLNMIQNGINTLR